MGKIKKILGIILAAISFITLSVLLVSSFSDRISPYTLSWLPFFGLFFPFILCLNILVFATVLLFRKWKLALLFLIVFAVCWNSIHTYFPIHSQTEKIPENCIKLLSYNVMRFEYLKKHTEKDPNAIVKYIVDCDADIICIQEYGTSANSKKDLNDTDLIKAFRSTPYYHIERLKPSHSERTYGLAIFSKFPILKIKKVPYDSQYNGSFVAELDINGKKVTLINNHLESNKLSHEERTGYYSLTSDINDINKEKLENFTHAMYRRLMPAYKTRAVQAQIVSKIVKENKNPYIIVCGDFNDTPVSYARHKIKGDHLNDAFVDSGNGMGITFNKYRFLFRIDYILHSKNIKAYNCTTGALKNSDHYPIQTYFELK